MSTFAFDDGGRGESRFVSKDMYKELISKCRCGRPRNHLTNCLQKVKGDACQFQENMATEREDSAKTKSKGMFSACAGCL